MFLVREAKPERFCDVCWEGKESERKIETDRRERERERERDAQKETHTHTHT